MLKDNVYKTYIQIEIDAKGIIQEIVDGKFILEVLKIGSSIYDVCPFLEVTFENLKVGKSHKIDGIFLKTSKSEYNIDVEFILEASKITVFLIDKSNVYEVVKKLNQERNDLFLAKTKILEQNKELEILRAKAERIAEGKSRFLAVMSHEIRNPLNAILGFGKIIETEAKDINIKQNINYLNEAGENLSIIVNNLLNLSRIESGRLELMSEPISLAEILTTSIKSYIVQIQHNNVKLVANLSKTLPDYVLGDSVRLSQIISNLISNAIKFTKKGKILIAAQTTQETADFISINFSIKDTGRGMTTSTIEKIFLDYEQAELNDNRLHSGAGLGLSIVKHLVESMKGTIKVESELGKGSTFSFDIPFKKVKKETPIKKITPPNTKVFDFTNLEILLADDDELTRIFVDYTLAKTGAKITLAKDGNEALQHLKNKRFDIVILDINMPEKTGIDVINAKNLFKKTNKLTPIVAATASLLNNNNAKYLKLGFTEVISKPYTPEKIKLVISTVLDNT
ncbi:MAG: hybrid sensor histidine kinase/response regulator [Vicingaceae bacterium]